MLCGSLEVMEQMQVLFDKKIKSPKEVTKQYELRFFLLFLLDDRRILLQIRIHTSD
jgi:hypothetical protein